MIHEATLLILLSSCSRLLAVQAVEHSPRIIIVGAGASGIAAASRLMENGFANITILEAENRIGGRVYTRKFGDYWVDMGGQWVHGEEDNVSFELAWPLGLLEHSTIPLRTKFVSSSGPTLSEEAGNKLLAYFFNITEFGPPDEYLNRSIGEYYTMKFDEYFDENPEITTEQRKALKAMFDLMEMAQEAGPTWFDVAVHQEDIRCAGDQGITWKVKGYGQILDILMKKYPDPTKELPVINSTMLNHEVTRINYNTTAGTVSVVSAYGTVYHADHVIVTTSVGVLKRDHRAMFNPTLPAEKINAIEGIELGNVAKIYLYYPAPWWIEPNRNSPDNFFFTVTWTDADKEEYANDPERAWLLSISTIILVEHKSKLLLCWLTGPLAKQMEEIPEAKVFEQIKQFFRRIFKPHYNISEPGSMLRSTWYTNRHFRGTWSYRSLNTVRSGAKSIHIERPILTDQGEPLVQFAGEATHSKHPSTVHGAIDSGWREATRLIQLYAGRSFLGGDTQAGRSFWRSFEKIPEEFATRLMSGTWQSAAAHLAKSKKN